MLKWIFRMLPKHTKIKINFYRNDLRDSKGIPMKTKLKMWRKGFRADEINYLDIDKNGTKYYYSSLFEKLTHPKNGQFSSLIDNKMYLPYCMKDFPEHCPTYNYYFSQGKIHELYGDFKVRNRSYKNVIEVFKSSKKIQVGKIIGMEGGVGVYFFEMVDGVKLKINGKNYNLKEAYNIIKKIENMVFMDAVEPHSYSRKLNETTNNTLRIHTAWDIEGNEPFVMYGLQKVGRSKMFGIDNAYSGGIFANINMKNGKMEKFFKINDNKFVFIEKHPDSGVQLTGMEVPRFKEMTDKLLIICKHLNFLKYIGWDILITEDSFKVLEMNSQPSMDIIQANWELLRDERTRKFFSQYVNKHNEKYFMR